MNYLTKTQLALIVFFVPLIFKMAMLPSLLYAECGADSYIAIGIISVAELAQMALVVFIAAKGGMYGIGEAYGKTVQRILALPFIFVMGVKSLVYVTEMYVYITDFLFYNISPVPIIAVIMLTVFYLASKGAKAIGRLFELAIWLIPLIALFGLLFGKAKLYPEYLTPLFADGAGGMAKGLDKYLIYTFDFSPLLFFKLERKKNVRLVAAAIMSCLSLVGLYMLLVASYGRALFLVNDAFARLASFNTVISEIGALDWPSILLWLTTATCSIALKLAAVGEISEYFSVKRNIGIGAVCLTLVILMIFVFSGFKEALNVGTSAIKYVVIGIEISIPFIMLVLYATKHGQKELKIETTV